MINSSIAQLAESSVTEGGVSAVGESRLGFPSRHHHPSRHGVRRAIERYSRVDLPLSLSFDRGSGLVRALRDSFPVCCVFPVGMMMTAKR